MSGSVLKSLFLVVDMIYGPELGGCCNCGDGDVWLVDGYAKSHRQIVHMILWPLLEIVSGDWHASLIRELIMSST